MPTSIGADAPFAGLDVPNIQMLLKPPTCWGRCKYSGSPERSRGGRSSDGEAGDQTECLRLYISYLLWVLYVPGVSPTDPSEKIRHLSAVLH